MLQVFGYRDGNTQCVFFRHKKLCTVTHNKYIQMTSQTLICMPDIIFFCSASRTSTLFTFNLTKERKKRQ